MTDAAWILGLLGAVILFGAFREHAAGNTRDAACLAGFGGAGALAGLGWLLA